MALFDIIRKYYNKSRDGDQRVHELWEVQAKFVELVKTFRKVCGKQDFSGYLQVRQSSILIRQEGISYET